MNFLKKLEFYTSNFYTIRTFDGNFYTVRLDNLNFKKPLNYQAFLYEIFFLQQTVIYTIINAFTVIFGKILSNAYDRTKFELQKTVK